MTIKKKFDPSDCYLTSDNHWFHKNILALCHRPFADIDDMNSQLVANWNDVVPTTGHVFVAGDMIHSGNIAMITGLLEKLNGTIYLIMGNHCYQNHFEHPVIKDLFEGRIYDSLSISINDTPIVSGMREMNIYISHYPHVFWPRNHVHAYGHVHSGPNSTSSDVVPFHPLRYDVGVDNNNYKPISYFEYREIILKQINEDGRITKRKS